MKLSTIGISITGLSLLFLASCANYERMCMNGGGTMEKMNVASCPSIDGGSSTFDGDGTSVTERPLALATGFAEGKGFAKFNFFDRDDVLTTLLKQPTTNKLIGVGATKNINVLSAIHRRFRQRRAGATQKSLRRNPT